MIITSDTSRQEVFIQKTNIFSYAEVQQNLKLMVLEGFAKEKILK